MQGLKFAGSLLDFVLLFEAVLSLFLRALLQRGPQVEQDRVRVGEIVQSLQVDQHPIHTWQEVFLGLFTLKETQLSITCLRLRLLEVVRGSTLLLYAVVPGKRLVDACLYPLEANALWRSNFLSGCI